MELLWYREDHFETPDFTTIYEGGTPTCPQCGKLTEEMEGHLRRNRMSDKLKGKKVSEAQENLKRIEDVIKPYIKPKEVVTPSPQGKWQTAPTPSHKSKTIGTSLTREDFLDALMKVSRPSKR